MVNFVAVEMEGDDQALMAGERLILTCLAKPYVYHDGRDDRGAEISNTSSLNIQLCAYSRTNSCESLPVDRLDRRNATAVHLSIINVTRYDSGVYRCCIGPDECSSRVTIQVKGKCMLLRTTARILKSRLNSDVINSRVSRVPLRYNNYVSRNRLRAAFNPKQTGKEATVCVAEMIVTRVTCSTLGTHSHRL
jgi:hypothetical protein